ncbi:DKNYY domain-containing protein [Shewanella algae]|uniref:DKNYY domain-containing protein n=1 Tax=Shewanella algae TaxID=38313 RepID=UPI0031F4F01E
MKQTNSQKKLTVERLLRVDSTEANLYRGEENIFFLADDKGCLLPIKDKEGATIYGIDTKAFAHLGGHFYGDKTHLYIRPERSGRWGVFPLVHGHLRILNEWYAFDERYLYSGMFGARRRIEGELRIPPGKGYYAVDSKHAYINSTRINNSCAVSFIGLECDYARDASQVYFRGKAIEGADPDSFLSFNFNERTGLGFDAIDKYRGYNLGKADLNSAEIKDLQLFFSLYPGSEKTYSWLLNSKSSTDETEPSWQFLGDGFAVTEQAVYFTLPPFALAGESLQGNHAGRLQDKDKYQCLTELAPGKFQYLQQGYYLYDCQLYWRDLEDRYHFCALKLSKVNTATFTCIGGEYFTDGSKVICRGKILKGVQPDVVQLYSEYLLSDGLSLYYRGKKLSRVMLENFEYLGHHYFSIAGQLYRHDRELKNAKSQSVYQSNCRFISAECLALNNSRVIYRNLLQNKQLDGASLVVFNHYFAKDGKHVYCIDWNDRFHVIAEADPKTFHAPDFRQDVKLQQKGHDKQRTFDWRQLLPEPEYS